MTTSNDVQHPFGCARCWPTSAEAAWEARGALAVEREIIDDSHLGVSIHSCSFCGQRFVTVFLEHVDWQDGDDSQYWTLMPITEAECTELSLMDKASAVARLNGLPAERPCLQKDHPKGGPDTISWSCGLWIVK